MKKIIVQQIRQIDRPGGPAYVVEVEGDGTTSCAMTFDAFFLDWDGEVLLTR